MSNWLFILAQVRRQLWLTVSLYCASAVIAALLAVWLAPLVPFKFSVKLGSSAVDDILSVLATSMLTVATFSLTTLVTAYTSVGNSIARHAARLITSDSGVRNPLGSFVGSFLYAIVGLIAVHTGAYGAQGRVILLFATIGVLILVVIAMLRWIGQLSKLAQLETVVERVVTAIEDALDAPSLTIGGEAAPAGALEGFEPLMSETVGFVQNIDMRRLRRAAETEGFSIRVAAAPGDFVHPGEPLLWVSEKVSEKVDGILLRAVKIGPERTFDQDPRYGCRVLGEIVSRALSTGVNDPGAAREVIYRTASMLAEHPHTGRSEPNEGPVRPPRVDPRSLLAEIYDPVLRYGPTDYALHIDVQRALQALAMASGPAMKAAAKTYARQALQTVLSSVRDEAPRRALAEAGAWSR